MTRQREEQLLRIAVHAIRPLLRYATFTGRASRTEFGCFALLASSLLFMAQSFDWLLFGSASATGPEFFTPEFFAPEFFTKVCIALLALPSVALIVRRLHDINRSGWWLGMVLLPIVGWVMILFNCLRPGRRGHNAYGPPPRHRYHRVDFAHS